MSKIIDKKLFEQIFGHTLETLANKIINTTSNEENPITIKNIDKNSDKPQEKDSSCNFVIQPNNRCIDLSDAIRLILDFNETI